MNLSIHIELKHLEPEVLNNFIMLAYCSLCVCNLFIRAGNRGHWPASVKLVTLPYLTIIDTLTKQTSLTNIATNDTVCYMYQHKVGALTFRIRFLHTILTGITIQNSAH